MAFFKRHSRRGSYDLFSTYSYCVPGTGGMFMLFLMFLIGAVLGSLIVSVMAFVSADFVMMYGTVISYPVMFIPPLLYASAQSRRNEFFETGYALDSNHFGSLGGFRMALTVSVMTMATAFMADTLNLILPPTPEWFDTTMEQLMQGPVWVTLLSVSVFAPLFEEWLCRGLVLRGLLQKMGPAAAISVSAIFFAVLHMNPWQALPAFILGLIFGYVYYKTGSLKLTMLMHCVNNTMAVVFSKIPSLADADNFTEVLSPWAYAGIFIACAAFTAAAFVVLRNIPFAKDGARSNCDEIPAMTID
ncbi:MAG: CPBP family intramembrane metalloprotease [Bacteroidales bacterium]|nr:CPBP family intramembrane metalloprotease [Bacteroidales bacterium]